MQMLESAHEIEVSVVMPCLNEVRTVGRCVDKALRALHQGGMSGEVIVADNGSTDGSQELARQQGAHVVAVDRRGYGSALQGGIAAARGKYVIMGDADDSYDFSAIGPFVEKLRQGDDLVMGNRFRGGIRPGAMPWLHRYVGNPVLTGILNLFFHTPVGDAHCGLRAFRKEGYERLRLTSPGMEFASEMVVKACLNRQKISEVPVVLYPDGRDRPPHLRSFRDGWRHLRFLLLMCPQWLYLVPALVLLGGGLALMLWPELPGQFGVGEFGFPTLLLGSIGEILGFQTLWVWTFARVHGRTSGLLPPGRFTDWLLSRLTPERGSAAGGALLACGLGLNRWAWGSGMLDFPAAMRWALWGCTALVLGVQTLQGCFFLAMLRMGSEARGRP
jgi:glycosyltransferase involved in cell wall biosynthesis